VVVLAAGVSMPVYGAEPGTDANGNGYVDVHGSIDPVVTETGFISLSVDGLGTNTPPGTIQVNKPAGATVRSAFMAAASTGEINYQIPNGDVKIDGVGVNWDASAPSSINSWNYWANVTALVKPKIDSSPAGLVDFSIDEVNTFSIDGEILAVIFNDPNQTTSNTIILLFGAQDVTGDTFNIGLAQPLNKSDPNLVLDLSLGISYGWQGSSQYSTINVNTVRMTSSAGGQDDGAENNGALLTVGGIGDSNANPPDPNALPNGDPRLDDELYSLLPFVNTGDTQITVYTQNPSMDDNIFFGALFLASTTAVVGEGIVLAPASDTNPINTPHTVEATLQDNAGHPIVGRAVTFNIVSGPNSGTTLIQTTNANGKANFTFSSYILGTDNTGQTITSNRVTKTWEGASVHMVPAVTNTGLLVIIVCLPILMFVFLFRRTQRAK
jgi:hypothetical protein